MASGNVLSSLLLYGHKASLLQGGMDVGANLGSGRKQAVLVRLPPEKQNQYDVWYICMYVRIYMCVCVRICVYREID